MTTVLAFSHEPTGNLCFVSDRLVNDNGWAYEDVTKVRAFKSEGGNYLVVGFSGELAFAQAVFRELEEAAFGLAFWDTMMKDAIIEYTRNLVMNIAKENNCLDTSGQGMPSFGSSLLFGCVGTGVWIIETDGCIVKGQDVVSIGAGRVPVKAAHLFCMQEMGMLSHYEDFDRASRHALAIHKAALECEPYSAKQDRTLVLVSNSQTQEAAQERILS